MFAFAPQRGLGLNEFQAAKGKSKRSAWLEKDGVLRNQAGARTNAVRSRRERRLSSLPPARRVGRTCRQELPGTPVPGSVRWADRADVSR